MNHKKLLFFLAFSFIFMPIHGFVQELSEGYDHQDRAVNVFEAEDKELQDKKINEYILRIKRGDSTILRLILFGTFEAMHKKILSISKDTKQSYFNILGGNNSLRAFVGGFDNQDPSVRLKCIGYLGHWVEEIGEDLPYLEKEIDRVLDSNIETRKEIRYAYKILKMKIVRKNILASVKVGEKILVRISPEEFLPLVYFEPRIRTIYLGSASAVKIGSISLDPNVEPETGRVFGSEYRPQDLNLEQMCYTKDYSGSASGSEVQQYMSETNAKEQDGSSVVASEASLNVQNEPVPVRASLDWDCVRGIYVGIDNKSQFVREHSARIFLNYIRGFTGDSNYMGNVSGKARLVSQELLKMARNPYFKRIAQVSWDNVKWSEFFYNDRVVSSSNILPFIKNRYYLEYSSGNDKSIELSVPKVQRYFTKDAVTYDEWATDITGNYRNDVKEILRVLGMSWYLDPEYRPGKSEIVQGTSRVSTLFNKSETQGVDRSDRLEGQSSS